MLNATFLAIFNHCVGGSVPKREGGVGTIDRYTTVLTSKLGKFLAKQDYGAAQYIGQGNGKLSSTAVFPPLWGIRQTPKRTEIFVVSGSELRAAAAAEGK